MKNQLHYTRGFKPISINDINSGDAKPDFTFHKSGDCSQQV